MTIYTYFWAGPFSNWALSPFVFKGVEFYTAEQAMMWEKAMLFADDISAAQILATTDPKRQKTLGRGVRGYDDTKWSAMRYEIVKDILRQKFSQHASSNQALMSTVGTILVEASPMDTIWGVGLSENDPRAWDESTWLGQNLLGKALTELRTEFENIALQLSKGRK